MPKRLKFRQTKDKNQEKFQIARKGHSRKETFLGGETFSEIKRASPKKTVEWDEKFRKTIKRKKCQIYWIWVKFRPILFSERKNRVRLTKIWCPWGDSNTRHAV